MMMHPLSCGVTNKPSAKGHVTPLELLLSVFIFALLALLLKLGAGRAQFDAKVQQVMVELKEIDKAVERVALEDRLNPGQRVTWEQYRRYLRGDTGDLREEDSDPFGNPYGSQMVGAPAQIPEATQSLLNHRLAQGYQLGSGTSQKIERHLDPGLTKRAPQEDSKIESRL